MKHNMYRKEKFLFFVNIITFIFLSWSCQHYKDEDSFGKILESRRYIYISLEVRTHRLLAKHELKHGLYKTQVKKKYSDFEMNKRAKNEAEEASTYSQKKKMDLNNFDSYMKDYNHRYSKKTGLGKLDCYYEKKVFNNFNNILGIIGNMRNNNKFYNKKLENKYIIRLIFWSLLPILGLIFPILFGGKVGKRIVPWTSGEHNQKYTGNKCSYCENGINIHVSKHVMEAVSWVNLILLCISFITVLSVNIYILLKLIKYARLKSGKGKMSVIEYCHFCKELIRAK